MNMSKLIFPALLMASVAFFSSCKSDANASDVSIEITDAPMDDPSVQGVFVTVAEVRVNGQAWDGLKSKTTINLLAYQQGMTKLLGKGSLAADSYSEVTFVLDANQDASGVAPGCYVMTQSGDKVALDLTSNEITVPTSFMANGGAATTIVADFDVRKAIAYGSSVAQPYKFVTTAELQAAVRVVEKSNSGTIKGKCTNPLINSERIVVYAYKKGSYSKGSASQPQGASGIRFAGAVSSSTVDSQGNYSLSYLTPDSYELVFVSYKDQDSDGKLDIQGSLVVDVAAGLSLSSISVAANANVTVNALVTGLLPF